MCVVPRLARRTTWRRLDSAEQIRRRFVPLRATRCQPRQRKPSVHVRLTSNSVETSGGIGEHVGTLLV